MGGRIKKKNEEVSLGRVACHLGHIKILKTFLKSNNKYALIFEDDIYVKNGDYKKNNNEIFHIIKNIPKDADIIYLDYCWEHCHKIKRHSYYFNKAHRPLCRHIYMVNKKAAKAIIDNTLPMTTNGDMMVSKLVQDKIINGYIVNPNVLDIKQNRKKMGSNLGNNDDLRKCF